MNFEVKEERSLADRIAIALADRIISGVIAPGEWLRQDHIAAEFGASHVPVREAFTLDDTWDLSVTNGVYAFEVHGPNGFLRRFAGTAAQSGPGKSGRAPAPAVTAHYDVANGNLFLKFTNAGTSVAHLNVTDNAYGAHERNVVVPAGGLIEEPWILASSHHWYDLTVTSRDDATFAWRFAGHIENGRPSISDPAAVAPVTKLS